MEDGTKWIKLKKKKEGKKKLTELWCGVSRYIISINVDGEKHPQSRDPSASEGSQESQVVQELKDTGY